VRVVVVKRQ